MPKTNARGRMTCVTLERMNLLYRGEDMSVRTDASNHIFFDGARDCTTLTAK